MLGEGVPLEQGCERGTPLKKLFYHYWHV